MAAKAKQTKLIADRLEISRVKPLMLTVCFISSSGRVKNTIEVIAKYQARIILRIRTGVVPFAKR